MTDDLKRTIPLFHSHAVGTEVGRAIAEVCESGYLNEGVQVAKLEEFLARYLDAPRHNATLLNSCTSALELALKLSGVGPGDSVITPSMTCVATNTPIIAAGANIVWADIDPNTGCIDPDDVGKLLWSARPVKAVICVDWAGNVCDLDKLNALCTQFGTKLIQDAAHAFGAKWHGDGIAQYADFTCFSFQAIKHFTTGDGGMLTCRDARAHARARRLKWFGLDRDAVKDPRGDWRGQQWDVDIVEAGRKFNMNNIAAAIGLTNAQSIQWIMLRHRMNAQVYDDAFAGTAISPLCLCQPQAQVSSHWVYTVRVDRRVRDQLMVRLNARGIKAGLVHVPNHNYTCFKEFKRELPGTDEFAATQLSLPCGWWVDPDEARQIAMIALGELNDIRI